MQCLLRENECLTVGSVMINVLKVLHDSVTLGITDPSASPSYREEVLYLRSENDDDDEQGEVFDPITIDDLISIEHSFTADEPRPFAISVL